MQYYNVKKIAEFTGYSEKKAYKVIADLNKDLIKENPNQLIFPAKIPVWYWEKRVGIERKESNEEEKVSVETVN